MAEIDRLEILVTADTKSAMQKLTNLQKKIAELDSGKGSAGDGLAKSVSKVAKEAKSMQIALQGVAKIESQMQGVLDRTFDATPVLECSKAIEYADLVMRRMMSGSRSLFDGLGGNRNAITPYVSEMEQLEQLWNRIMMTTVPNWTFGNGQGTAVVPFEQYAQSADEFAQSLRDLTAIEVEYTEVQANMKSKFPLYSNMTMDYPSEVDNYTRQALLSADAFISKLKTPIPPTMEQSVFSLASALKGGLLGALSAVTPALKAVGVAGLKGLGKLFALPFKKLGQSIKDTAKSFAKLRSSIARVVLYRTLRAILKQITDGFNEGVKAVSRYSRSIGGEFSKTMDELTSHLALLKGSVGAMASPLITALAPAIHTVTNAVIQLINAMNQLFSLMSGKSGWTKATSAVQKYDDTVSGASKSQKELTAGIDELNILNESGGGSGTVADYNFEETPFDGWAEKLKDLWDMGKYIDFGKSLADIFNEKIAEWDAVESGRKLGDKIESIIEVSYGFLKNLNSEMLGGKVAQFFNSALERIDTELLGMTIGEKWNRIVDFFYGLAYWTDFGQLTQKITDFFNGAIKAFDQFKLADTVSLLSSKFIDFIGDTIRNFPLTAMVNGIMDFFGRVRWGDIGYEVGNLARDIVLKGIEGVIAFIDNFDIGDFSIGLTEFIFKIIDGVDIPTIVAKLITLALRIINQVIGFLGNFVPALLLSGNPTQLKELYAQYQADTDSWTAKMQSTIKGWTDNIETNIADFLSTEEADVDKGVNAITSNIGEGALTVEGLLGGTAKEVKASVGEAVAYAYDEVYGGMVRIGNVLTDGSTTVKNSAIDLGNSVAIPWAKFDETATKAEDMSVKASKSFEKVQTATSTSWSQIKETTSKDWDLIQKKVTDTWKLIEKDAKTIFGEIVKVVTDAYIEIKSATDLKFGKDGEIYVLIDNALAQIQGAFNARFDGNTSIQSFVVGAFNSMETGIGNALNLTYTHIDDFVTKAITRIGDLIDKIQEYNTEAEGSELDIELSRIKAYANGGFVQSGQLFLAREAGAEMVGNIGGRTGVANNDQIVEGISSGVYSAVLSAMSQTSGTSNINVYLDGKKIEASVRDTKQRRGATIASGGVLNYA